MTMPKQMDLLSSVPPDGLFEQSVSRVLDNYEALLELWRECLQANPKPDPDIRGRIIACQAQMESFDFFFGLNLGHRISPKQITYRKPYKSPAGQPLADSVMLYLPWKC